MNQEWIVGEYSINNENKQYPAKWVNRNTILNKKVINNCLHYETIYIKPQKQERINISSRNHKNM